MGHLAKYNLKPPPHGHAQALHCAPSVCQHLQLTHFLPSSVHAVQRAHLHSRSRSLHSTPLILAWSRLIRSRHTMRVRAQVCYSCPSSKANHGEPSHFSNAWDGGQEFRRARKVADSEDIINRVNSASLSMGVELAVGVCSWRDSTQRRQNRPASVSKLHHLWRVLRSLSLICAFLSHQRCVPSHKESGSSQNVFNSNRRPIL